MDPAQHQHTSLTECLERRRHQLTGRSETDGSIQLFRRLFRGAAAPGRAQLARQAAVLLLARAHENLGLPVLRYLKAHVAGSPESVDSEVATRPDSRNAQAA